MERWKNLTKEEKVKRIEILLGSLLILGGIIFLSLAIFKKESFFLYAYPISISFLFLGGYSLILTFVKSLETIPISSRIELFIGLLSATLFFGAFFMAYISNDMNIKNEFSSVYNNFKCPNFIDNKNYTSVNFTLLNSDLTKGIGVFPKFIGKGICIQTEDKCENEGTWKGIMILAGENSTFTMNLKKIGKRADYTIELYNNQGFKISYIDTCSYNS